MMGMIRITMMGMIENQTHLKEKNARLEVSSFLNCLKPLNLVYYVLKHNRT